MIDYDRAALDRELSRDEGRKSELYHDDRGILTGGIGHNFEAQETPADVLALLPEGWIAQLGATLSEAAIDLLFDHDVEGSERGLDGLLPNWRDMDAARQRVFLNLCFNMGAAKLGKFKDTLEAAKIGDWAGVAAGLTASAWHAELPARSARLIAMVESGQSVEAVV